MAISFGNLGLQKLNDDKQAIIGWLCSSEELDFAIIVAKMIHYCYKILSYLSQEEDLLNSFSDLVKTFTQS